MSDSVGSLLLKVARRTLQFDMTVWCWGDAIAVDGLLDASALLDAPFLKEPVRRLFDRWIEFSAHRFGWGDHLMPGLSLLRCAGDVGADGYLQAGEDLAQWLMRWVPRSSDGAHLFSPDDPLYRHSVWVDSLYHTPSYFMKLGQATGDQTYCDFAMEILLSHLRALRPDGSSLLAHSLDTGTRVLHGPEWGRGNGWAVLGLVDTWEVAPPHLRGRATLAKEFANLCSALLPLQDESGFWRTLLRDTAAYLESSTAAMMGAAFLKGQRLGLLSDPAYGAACARAHRAVFSRVAADGSFEGVSADTNPTPSPDDDPSVYRRLPVETNIWGQGAALRFLAEEVRLQKGGQ